MQILRLYRRVNKLLAIYYKSQYIERIWNILGRKQVAIYRNIKLMTRLHYRSIQIYFIVFIVFPKKRNSIPAGCKSNNNAKLCTLSCRVSRNCSITLPVYVVCNHNYRNKYLNRNAVTGGGKTENGYISRLYNTNGGSCGFTSFSRAK